MKRYLLLVGPLVMFCSADAWAIPSDFIPAPPSRPPFESFYVSSGQEDRLFFNVESEKSAFQSEDYEDGQKVGDGQRDGQKQEYVRIDEHEYGDGYKDGRRDEDEGGKKDGDGHGCKHKCNNLPEPGSLLLLGAGLAGIGIWRRKAAKRGKLQG